MPRDGLQQYAPPPGTQGVANYTIESARYNTFVADITADQNTPRPIVAGGTGANNALQAMQNLGGEIAKQIITNYSSAPWVNGSFYSAAGATGAPNPTNRFAGIYYGNADDSYATIEARDQTTGILYVQQKAAGVWSGTWLQGPGSLTDTDARYVNVAGDTMTGNLNIQTTGGGSVLTLFKSTTASNGIISYSSGQPRWSMDFGDAAPESGGNAGSNFYLRRYSDAGAQLDLPISISRANGNIVFANTVTAGNGGTTGTYYFGNSGTKSLSYDGTNFNLVGGNIYSLNHIINTHANVAPTNGVTVGMAAKSTAGAGAIAFQSNDATNRFDAVIQAITDPTATNRRLSLSCLDNGVAWRNITLCEAGGAVGVGTPTPSPAAKFHVHANTNVNFVVQDGGSGVTVIGAVNDPASLNTRLDIVGSNFKVQDGGLTLNPVTSGLPQVSFGISTAVQSFINDNSSSINVYSNGAGTAGMYIVHGGNAWSTISDARLPYKKTARPLSVLDKIDKVQLYENEVGDHLELFVKAQEFNEVFPHLVIPGSGPDDMEITQQDVAKGGIVWGVSYDRAGVAALQGLKEAMVIIAELRAKVAALEAK